jgi:hypothetical protein
MDGRAGGLWKGGTSGAELLREMNQVDSYCGESAV